MRKNILMLLMVLILAVTFTACTQKEEKEDVSTEVEEVDVETNDEAEETEAAEEKNEKEMQEETNDKAEEVQDVQEESNDLDVAVEGQSLLDTLSNQRPEKLMVKAEMISFGTTTEITTYYDGDNFSTSTDIPDLGMNIVLYVADEGVMYQYIYGEDTGVKIIGADSDYATEMSGMMDTSMLAKITNDSSEDIVARVETLDGEEVIYIEATESENDMGDVLVKMWYSDKYGMPLKYEIIMGEQQMSQYTVTMITDSVNFDETTFLPPDDVNFQEVDMEAMMNNF